MQLWKICSFCFDPHLFCPSELLELVVSPKTNFQNDYLNKYNDIILAYDLRKTSLRSNLGQGYVIVVTGGRLPILEQGFSIILNSK